MPERLPGLPQLRSIPDPTSYEPLAGFSCGKAAHERDVDKAVDELLEMSSEEAATYEVRVAEDRVTGDLIGISCFHKRPLSDDEIFADAVYLAVIAINEPYRGWRLPDGVTRIGTFLLCDSLAQIGHIWGNPTMPYVWGVVHRDNQPCRRLLSAHGFWRIGGSNRHPSIPYFVHMRDEGVNSAHRFTAQVTEAVERAAES